MITSITFVTGAGASAPYGLPLGDQLLREARDLTPQHPIVQLLYEMFSIDLVNAWIAGLRISPVRSLDKFVQERADYEPYAELGKTVIAAVMARWIQQPHERPEDWIEEVLNAMCEGAANWRQFEERNSDVSFVTFNFDSVLELRTNDYLSRRFRDFDEIACSRMLPVHHVHGRLGAPPQHKLNDQHRRSLDEWRTWLETARNQIRVVHDADVDRRVLDRANNALTNAKIVMFLGLHYFLENLERLSIPSSFNAQRRQRVFGSAYGLTAGQRQWVEEHVREIHLAEKDDKCVDVLKRFNWRSHSLATRRRDLS